MEERIAMLFEGGFNFSNFLLDVFTIFVFVLWFWLLVTIVSDLVRRHDISGWVKALWLILVIFTSYIGVIIYLITQAKGMAERNARQAEAARDELRRAIGFSVADEIAKLDQLKSAGSISNDEFTRLRARLVS
jgi:Phospholipase_D-nuclease N-terminal